MLRLSPTLVATLLFSFSSHAQDAGHEHHATDGAAVVDHAAMGHAMTGMYGPYGMAREASGTSWQPDSASMMGVHGSLGEWSTMLHGFATTVYDDQGGPRGDTKTFTASMLMLMGQRQAAGGTLGLRGMVSLDPTMGKGGYPLLFQTGESANGVDPLVDRQHPHDFLMELSGSYSRPVAGDSSVFVYAGMPGEPALGPPAFMHRFSGMFNPEAPLTHHWLDATHITFGVATIGAVWNDWKIEGSVFNGREPDENRWNIDGGKLDSASARLSWNPARNWSLQVSHGRLDSPEQLEPEVSVRRTTASAIYDTDLPIGKWQTTFAWGRNVKDPGSTTDGYLLESALQMKRIHTVFARAEHVGKDELFDHDDPLHGQVFDVDKLSVGYLYDFYRARHVTVGLGGLVSGYRYPEELDAAYGKEPVSYMVFVQARLE
ncbi:MAG TPA: hypothetical protein VF460_05965 [Burkholderiales bacterium]